MPMKMEHTKCSETSAYKMQTPGNNQEESIRLSYCLCLLLMLDTLLPVPSLHRNTSLHFTTLHSTTLHYTYRHFTSSHLHFTTLLFGLTNLHERMEVWLHSFVPRKLAQALMLLAAQTAVQPPSASLLIRFVLSSDHPAHLRATLSKSSLDSGSSFTPQSLYLR